jgi:hypothetical protein
MAKGVSSGRPSAYLAIGEIRLTASRGEEVEPGQGMRGGPTDGESTVAKGVRSRPERQSGGSADAVELRAYVSIATRESGLARSLPRFFTFFY